MTTIKEHCCGADLFFNKKTAAKEYQKYLKKGPVKATAKIIQQLEEHNLENKTLIDVGGGIGAIQWWFLEQGGMQTTDIDASSGYLKKAENHALGNGWKMQDFALLEVHLEGCTGRAVKTWHKRLLSR